jgi:hypothetical protein
MGPHRNSCTIARFDGPIPGNPIVAASRVLRGRGHYTAVRLALRTKGRQGQHLPSDRCPNFLIMPPRPPALLQCSTRRGRPERPGTAKTRFFIHKHAPRQHQIAAQGIEDVLPRTQSLRVPEGDRSIYLQRTHRIGQNPVRSPISSTDSIAGSNRSHTDFVTR